MYIPVVYTGHLYHVYTSSIYRTSLSCIYYQYIQDISIMYILLVYTCICGRNCRLDPLYLENGCVGQTSTMNTSRRSGHRANRHLTGIVMLIYSNQSVMGSQHINQSEQLNLKIIYYRYCKLNTSSSKSTILLIKLRFLIIYYLLFIIIIIIIIYFR